jgi:hypothetical protein
MNSLHWEQQIPHLDFGLIGPRKFLFQAEEHTDILIHSYNKSIIKPSGVGTFFRINQRFTDGISLHLLKLLVFLWAIQRGKTEFFVAQM